MKVRAWLLLILVAVSSISFVCAEVRVNEVMAKTPASKYGSNCEWIEIRTDIPLDITNWTLDTSGQKTNFSFYLEDFLIITMNKTSFLNNWNIDDNKVIEWRGIGLSDNGDSVYLFNNTELISNFSYSSSNENKSWQNCDETWKNELATPLMINNCTIPEPSCNQNWSCSSWSACTSSSQSRTCSDTNNCNNNTGKPSETNSCVSENASAQLTLDLEWNDEDIINNREFDIVIRAYNLENKTYDIRLWLEPYDDSTIISERYGSYNSEEMWRSGKYYIEEVFSNSGNQSKIINLRLQTNYQNFSGDARINVKLRETTTESIKSELSKIITVKEQVNQNNNQILNLNDTNASILISNLNNNNQNPEIIVLGQKHEKTLDSKIVPNSIIYKSKNEYIKEYIPYAFGILCIIIIILLVIEKGKKTKNE